MQIAEYNRLRVAADLAAAATYTSLAVPCLGARTVAFYATATNANAAQTATYECSLDGGLTWIAANVAVDFINTNGNIGNSALTTGRCDFHVPRTPTATAGAAPVFVCTHIRIIILGHATLTITGLAVTARVFSESGVPSQYPVPAA